MKGAVTRVLHVITDLQRGGAETVLEGLIKGSCGRPEFRHSVLCLSGQDHFNLAGSGIQVNCIGMRPGRPRTSDLSRVRDAIRQSGPSLIHGWMYHGNLAAWLASPWHTPLIWSIHHSLHAPANDRWSTRTLIHACGYLSRHRVARIVYCSEASKAQHEAIGYAGSKAVLIPNGVASDLFHPDEIARRELRGRLGLSGSDFLFGFVGRLHPVKNVPGLLKAFSRILGRSGRLPHLLLAGSGLEPSNPDIASLVGGLGIRERVHLLGERSDVARVLPALDAYVSFSWSEAFPLGVAEAMSCGVPCVVTDVGDSRQLVHQSGELVGPGCEHDLISAMTSLIDASAERRAEMGNDARTRVVKLYDLQDIVGRYLSLYADVAGGSSG